MRHKFIVSMRVSRQVIEIDIHSQLLKFFHSFSLMYIVMNRLPFLKLLHNTSSILSIIRIIIAQFKTENIIIKDNLRILTSLRNLQNHFSSLFRFGFHQPNEFGLLQSASFFAFFGEFKVIILKFYKLRGNFD